MDLSISQSTKQGKEMAFYSHLGPESFTSASLLITRKSRGSLSRYCLDFRGDRRLDAGVKAAGVKARWEATSYFWPYDLFRLDSFPVA